MEQFVIGCKALLLTFNMYNVYIKLHIFCHSLLSPLHLSNTAEHAWKYSQRKQAATKGFPPRDTNLLVNSNVTKKL